MKISVSIEIDKRQEKAIKSYLKEVGVSDKPNKQNIKYELQQYLYGYFDGGLPALQFHYEN